MRKNEKNAKKRGKIRGAACAEGVNGLCEVDFLKENVYNRAVKGCGERIKRLYCNAYFLENRGVKSRLENAERAQANG